MNRSYELWPLRKVLAIFLLAALSWAGAAAGADLPFKAGVSGVTVYSDRALVTRSVHLRLERGSHRLAVEDLPAALQEGSLRVALRGNGGRIGGSTVKRVFLEKPQDPRIGKLEKEIHQLEVEDAALSDQLDALKLQEEFLKSIQVSSAQDISKALALKRPDLQEWKEILAFLRTGLTEVRDGARATREKRREIQTRIEVLRKELQQILSAAPRERQTASVEVEIDREGEFGLELTYLVGEAGWRPSYRVRALTEAKELELDYLAEVRQKTGEDWTQVQLALSTASPGLPGRPPQLRPWIVRFPEPIRPLPRAKAEAPMAAEALREEMAAAAPPPVEAQRLGASVQFQVRRRETLPSDGLPHRVIIHTERIKGDFAYFCVPKLSERAYLQVKATHTADYPLLPGELEAFVGADYTGKSWLDLVAPGEKMELHLGVDEEVKVQRELLKRERGEKGLFGKRERLHLLYRIRLENFKESDQQVEVLDQLPVSQESEIVVEAKRMDPPPVERAEQGMLRWRLEMKPKEKREILLEFEVTYPEGKEVEGL